MGRNSQLLRMEVSALEIYRNQREALLSHLAAELEADERFVAAWLAGSYGRGEADAASDLDLVLVIATPYCQALCARTGMTGFQPPEERLDLFRRFGEPAVIHENHHNAPLEGTFSFVLYRGSALVVDWTLVPEASARRPLQSLLLFDRAGIPVQHAVPLGSSAHRATAAAERAAFFWMMAVVTAKYIHRRDTVFVLGLLEMLYHTLREAEAALAGECLSFQRGSIAPIELTPARQVDVVRSLIPRVLKVEEEIIRLGVELPAAPLAEVDRLLEFASSE